ncbi:MAG: hypothetical protein DRJ05_13005 [Bacteroidetes bacterium]|nr:MAG: hypothetical protein DRJ05_13005 [Bacteroidota bacterium]
MDLQYVADLTGKPTAVIIPISDWERIKRVYFDRKNDFEDYNEEVALKGIEQAVKEMNSIKRGEIKSRPLEELLNEL